MILLFPEPFGPEITVNPGKNGIFVFLPKDLKLSISSCVICKPLHQSKEGKLFS